MAFTIKKWVDRISEYPNRRKIKSKNGIEESVFVSRDEGTVQQEGDSFSAQNMNDLEERVASAFQDVSLSINEYLSEVQKDGVVVNGKGWTSVKYLKSISSSLDALVDLLDEKQPASTAITTSNIGNQSVKHAESAGSANSANSADKAATADTAANAVHATNADTATKAQSADSAGVATRATYDANGDNIHDTFNWILNNYLPTTASCNRNWNWSGQGGQPTWLWGGNDGANMYVYNPANFDVYSSHHIVTGANGNVSVGLSSDGANFRTYVKSTGGALDNAVNLGSGSYRWKQVYAGTATISTSDRNLKKDIKELDENHLKFFLLLTPVSFQFIDGDSGRTHIGFIAQDVEGAMAQCGLTALDFAGFCKDVKVKTVPVEKEVELEDGTVATYTDYVDEAVLDSDGNPEYIYSLRYEEFIALVTYAVQKLYKRVDELENWMKEMEDRLAALEK